MISTTKSIRYKFSNGQWALQNHPYSIYMKFSGGYRKLFTGLTFFNGQGVTEIYIDPILRNFIYRWETTYYDDQLYRPTNYLENVNDIISPIENGRQFITTTIKVTVGEAEELVQEQDVTGIYSAFYENNKFEIINPFDENQPMRFQNLTTYNKSVPHIPNVSTDKFWLGINFSTNSAYGANPLYLKSPKATIEIKKEDYGDYAVAYSLKTLKEKLKYGNERSGILMSNTPNILAKLDQSVAIIDSKCDTADYYVAFTCNYAWYSFGFSGNTYQTIENDNQKIENSFGHQEVIWNKTKTKFRLNTSIIKEEEYKSLMGLAEAYKIYVYDVKNNKGTWCTLVSKSIQGNPNTIKRKAIQMNIELEENKFLIA